MSRPRQVEELGEMERIRQTEDTDRIEAVYEISAENPPGHSTDVLAWQMIEQGRYMPRRIRGSFRGRELG